MISHASHTYGRGSANRLDATGSHDLAGAKALVETFYYAFNQQDMEVFRQVWADDELIQLNNPLGGILRGHEAIAGLYQRIFNGPATVWVELHDIVLFETADMVVFAGREQGAFQRGDLSLDLAIRTSRVVQWVDGRWRQTHHHGSIDDAARLATYQDAVKGG